jgi:hypothetical protein
MAAASEVKQLACPEADGGDRQQPLLTGSRFCFIADIQFDRLTIENRA